MNITENLTESMKDERGASEQRGFVAAVGHPDKVSSASVGAGWRPYQRVQNLHLSNEHKRVVFRLIFEKKITESHLDFFDDDASGNEDLALALEDWAQMFIDKRNADYIALTGKPRPNLFTPATAPAEKVLTDTKWASFYSPSAVWNFFASFRTDSRTSSTASDSSGSSVSTAPTVHSFVDSCVAECAEDNAAAVANNAVEHCSEENDSDYSDWDIHDEQQILLQHHTTATPPSLWRRRLGASKY